MNRYLLFRLRHSLLLVRYYLTFTLLIILALIATIRVIYAIEPSYPITNNLGSTNTAPQIEITQVDPPLTLIAQEQESLNYSNTQENIVDLLNSSMEIDPTCQDNVLILYSPLLYSYWSQQALDNEGVQDLTDNNPATKNLSSVEMVNNELLHETITDLILQHEEEPFDETIKLLSQPLKEENDIANVATTPATSSNNIRSNSSLTLSHAAVIDVANPIDLIGINGSPKELDLISGHSSIRLDINKLASTEDRYDHSSKIGTQEEEKSLNNYLLYALFPHHKERILSAPLSKAYKGNHENHSDELSIMKLADKIDTSLSVNNEYLDTHDAQFDEDAEFEIELATESYFDSYQEYQQHYKTIDEEAVLLLESQSYPYVQDLQLEEELSSAEFVDLSINQQIEQLLTTGDYYILADDIIKGRQYYIQAVRIGAKEKNSPSYAKALVKLADLEENPYLARFQYTNALDIYETHVGFDMEVADILVKLVWTFDVTTERIVIYELLTRAKHILEKYSYSPQYTMVLRNLAIYYEAVDDFDNADAHYHAALALDLEHLGANDIRTILALENYAEFYLKFQEYQKAEEILLFKLNTHEEAETTDYYNLGRTQSMLGWTYLQQQNIEEALHYYNAALGNINYSITKNRFMPHYYSLPAIFDLIYLFTITNEPDRALPYFQVARALLASENESSTLEYLKDTPKEQIELNRIVHYPWAATAEIEGLITIMGYLDKSGED